MYVEEPIKFNREEFTLLIEDTDRHRICWMYHDVLSDQQIALLFTRLIGQEEEDRENQTVMAWVAPCQQENSCYLLFKWYNDFYDPPERIDLYLLRRQGSNTGELIIQPIQMVFANRLTEKGKVWYRNLWGKVSENVSWFFGEADFEEDAMLHILQQVTSRRGHEMELFEQYYNKRSDGELAIQCKAVEAYFRSIQAVDEVVRTVMEDRKQARYAQVMGEILERMSAVVDLNRVAGYAFSFSRMSDSFFRQPVRIPELNRNAGRQLVSLTERNEIYWMQLREWASQDVLRELYFRCNPTGAWDVFLPWRGEIYFTVLRRSAARELHRGVYLLTRFMDHRGRYVTDLFWLENTMECVAHLCGGEFFQDLMGTVRSSYVRQAELPQPEDGISVEWIYHQLKALCYESGERKWRRP